jgi:hypothetical protein
MKSDSNRSGIGEDHVRLYLDQLFRELRNCSPLTAR